MDAKMSADTRKIVTSHEFPPIPDRRFDWIAYYEGEEEAGDYGTGATEAEAIQDFIENYQEGHDERLAEKRDPTVCEACDGNGEIVFAIWVHEPGCGYGHESSDGHPCEQCGGTGKAIPEPRRPSWMGTRPITPNWSDSSVATDDDLPF